MNKEMIEEKFRILSEEIDSPENYILVEQKIRKNLLKSSQEHRKILIRSKEFAKHRIVY